MKPLAKGLLVALTLATVAFFLAGMPGLVDVPGWFYRARDKGVGGTLTAVFLLACLPWLVAHALRVSATGAHRRGAALLFTAALTVQIVMSLVAARGLSEVWGRHVHGHGEFFRVAHARRSAPIETLRRYESLVEEGALGSFAPSKPPGALGVYMLIDAAAEAEPLRTLLAPLSDDARRQPRLAEVAPAAALSFLLMPLMTALLVPALLLLARQLFSDRETGAAAAILVFSSPAVLLISYHLDGALYPLLAVLACGLVSLAGRSGRAWVAAFGGGLLCLGVYVSFSLLPAIGLALGCILAVTIEKVRAGSRRDWLRGGWTLVAMLVGFFAVLFVLRATLDFDPLTRNRLALAYHANWKAAVPTALWRGMAVVELGIYLGVPLFVAWILRSGLAITRLLTSRFTAAELSAVGLATIVAALAVFAGTNEVARMWLFLVPFIALVVGTGLRDLEREGRGWHEPLLWLASAQLVIALVMKGTQVW